MELKEYKEILQNILESQLKESDLIIEELEEEQGYGKIEERCLLREEKAISCTLCDVIELLNEIEKKDFKKPSSFISYGAVELIKIESEVK
tara:strand:+ start:20 stop:292 length:273 start_codon:yes stop_codon:yes gene_type:complete